MNKDCEVCQKVIRNKHKHDITWKIACLFFALLSIIFMVLYFGSGSMVKKTTIQIDNTQIENGGDNGSISIGSDNGSVTGTVETKDDGSLMIFLGIIAGSIIIAGGVVVCQYLYTRK